MANVIEKFSEFEKASELLLKGYNNAEIARELGCTPAYAKSLVVQYKEWVKTRTLEDPDFLDRLADNTLQALDEVNMIYKEAWTAHETAKENGLMNHEIASLKLLSEIAEKKAKLLQLMGAKADGGNLAQLKRAEQVNNIVSDVLKNVVKDCPRCRDEVMSQLATAFDLMGRGEDIVDMHEVENGTYSA